MQLASSGSFVKPDAFFISLFDAVVVFLDIVEMQYIVGITREGSFLCLKFGGTAF